jgi:hypothetical protein
MGGRHDHLSDFLLLHYPHLNISAACPSRFIFRQGLLNDFVISLSIPPDNGGISTQMTLSFEYHHFLLKDVMVVLIIRSDETIDVHTAR